MTKLYRKLTKEQRERGVYFSSTLSNYRTETASDKVHEITHEEYRENASECEKKEARLRNSSFFDGLYKYNIIRS